MTLRKRMERLRPPRNRVQVWHQVNGDTWQSRATAEVLSRAELRERQASGDVVILVTREELTP